MADSDPISDAQEAPHKRRRLNDKGWDSQNDSAEEFTAEDFETVPTMPQSQGNKRKLQYPPSQFHKDLQPSHTLPSSGTVGRASSPNTFITQPTMRVTQATQATMPLPRATPPTPSSDIQVPASSPARVPPSPQVQRAPPAPMRPGGLLASAMAPPGTAFRRPLGVQQRPSPINVDSDDEDPPVHHSSDEETQGLSSNIKPTNFKKGGRGLDSTPNRSDKVRQPVIRQSPVAEPPSNFSNLMRQFDYQPSSTSSARAPDDMISAYGGNRRPRPQQPPPRQTVPSRAKPVLTMRKFNTLEDIQDSFSEKKVRAMLLVRTGDSIDRCMAALAKNRGNQQDALNWLFAQDGDDEDAPGEVDEDAPGQPYSSTDELGSVTPAVRRGVAVPKAPMQSQASMASKQQVSAPTMTIAEKYASTQAARRQSQYSAVQDEEEEEVKPRRRLIKGRNRRRSPSPPSSPPAPQASRESKRQQPIVLSDDDDEDEVSVSAEPPEIETSSHDENLLKFFNECSVRDLADISAQAESVAQLFVDSRPFASLDNVRTVSKSAPTTKSGKASKAKPIGDKVVNDCSEMLQGYDAVDELVEECDRLSKPILEALKTWGVGPSADGELQLMNLDEAHDSGIGTPASSSASDDVSLVNGDKPKPGGKARKFLGQPTTMNPETTLKNYQLVGLNWVNLLWSKGLSCILADDMGLGKTCQIISFLAHLQEQKVNGCHLVIVPGSTLENWLREFARFAPDLHVVPYYGSQAERLEAQDRIDADFDTIDVVVTTYDMAVKESDNKFLRKKVDPLVCIYDEAHALRNVKSQRYSQLTKIRAQFRVLLTGTPLQNNLQELVAILAFIMPDMFADKDEQLQYIFKHKATTKSADHGALLSAQRTARARSMMTPFILRRKKQQVLELPTKHSRVEYCEMTAEQANYYADIVEEAQKHFSEKATAGKGAVSKKASSNVLMELRKAALHPLLARKHFNDKRIDKMVAELVKKGEFASNRPDQIKSYLDGTAPQKLEGGSSDYNLNRFCLAPGREAVKKFALKVKKPWMDSGKVHKCCELLKAFAKNGDRVLVFSQFTMMMDILEAVLDTMKIKFMRLDGSTNMQERQDMIDKFTNEENITVFMLSTRAGGAGINLAAANKVIIFDSGFNPQDDIQAENRAHRVGQMREVEVVRLVTRGTIEEQIHALGESKLALDEKVAGDGNGAEEEKKGEELVEKMLKDGMQKRSKEAEPADLKDTFKSSLENAGVKVASRQAQF